MAKNKDELLTVELNHKDCMAAIETCYKAKQPAIIWGNPGIGKSQGIKELTEKLGIEFIDLRLSQLDSVDIRGIPVPTKQKNGETEAVWALPEFLPKDENWKGIIFLDEINQGMPSVLNAIFQMVLDRKIGEYNLPKGAYVVAAANDKEANRNVVELSPPLLDRFIHLNMTVNSDEWLEWAITNQINSDIVGYIKTHPEQLANFKEMYKTKVFPTPRSWDKVNTILNDSLSYTVQTALVSGCVGQAVAFDFDNYRKITSKLPDPNQILDGKLKKLKNENVDALYALITGLSYKLKERYKLKTSGKMEQEKYEDAVENFLNFVDNLPNDELAIMTLKTVSGPDVSINTSRPILIKLTKKYMKILKEIGLA